MRFWFEADFLLQQPKGLAHRQEMDRYRRSLRHRLQSHHGLDDHGSRSEHHRSRARHEQR